MGRPGGGRCAADIAREPSPEKKRCAGLTSLAGGGAKGLHGSLGDIHCAPVDPDVSGKMHVSTGSEPPGRRDAVRRLEERVPYRATSLASAYQGIDRLPVSVILDNVRSLYNVGSFFRTADAAGIETLILSGITGRPPSRQIAKTALGAEEAVRWEGRDQPAQIVGQMRARGYEIAAIETSLRAVDLFDWQPHFPLCVIFGHEVEGLGPELLDLCDTHVRIPMLGIKHSLNVATAGGVVLYELLRKYRRLSDKGRSGA